MSTVVHPPLYRVAARRPLGATVPWVPAFVAFQLLCQLALVAGDLGWARVVVRMAAFGSSLLLLLLLRGPGSRHPAAAAGAVALLTVGICLAHPDTNGWMAGVAQVGLYAAVLGPLFWVPRLARVDLRTVRATVVILWGFHMLSAALGVLQVYRPGTFQPPVSAVVESKGKGYVESLKITTASGQRVLRPMGLTDVPGGAGISGLYAVLLGVGFFLTRRTAGVLAVSLGSVALGVSCLYLSQVRALVVMTAISLAAIGGVLLWRRDVRRLTMLLTGVLVMMGVGWAAASSMTAPDASARMGTLVAAQPGAVYYQHRGRFLEDALLRTLPRAPFGEGLGHWGMTASYFGRGGPGAKAIWVEIQWAGWIVDGGAPLLLAYLWTILLGLIATWRIAMAPPRGPADDLPFWGVIVLAYSIGATALTFSYPIFLSQAGMEFWLLNGTLFAAARNTRGLLPAGA